MVLKVISKYIKIKYKAVNWYPAAYKITKEYCKIRPLKNKKLIAINHATKLNSLLSVITENGVNFPIPMKIKGLELFNTPRPNGVILCSVHIPLIQASIMSLVEYGCKPDAVIVKRHVKNDSFPLIGIVDTIPILYNSPRVLIKAKKILQDGGRLIVLTDEDIGDELYSPNIFVFANKVKADIIYFFAELLSDGTIEASFYEAPKQNDIKIDELIKRQIDVLNNHRNKILNIKQDFVMIKPSKLTTTHNHCAKSS